MTTTLELKFQSGNAAFDDNPQQETARILRELADDIEASGMFCQGNLTDVNGNTVGSFHFEVQPCTQN